MPKKTIKCLILILLSFTVISCSNIPQEVPQLSVELGKNLKLIEQSHLNLLRKYFNLRRELVDDFLYNEWMPKYAENFFSNPQIERVWNEVVRSNSKEKRMEFILTLAPQLQKEINAKRKSLIDPLDDLEELLEDKIRASYNDANATNNSITSFLVSAYKVDENRKNFFEKLGVEETEINTTINELDEITDKLSKSSIEYDKKSDEYLEQINKLKKEMK